MYTFDFTTEQVQKNEGEFVTKRFNEEKPEDIIEEMLVVSTLVTIARWT